MIRIDLHSVHAIDGFLVGRVVRDGYIDGYAYIHEGKFYLSDEYPVRNGFGY